MDKRVDEGVAEITTSPPVTHDCRDGRAYKAGAFLSKRVEGWQAMGVNRLEYEGNFIDEQQQTLRHKEVVLKVPETSVRGKGSSPPPPPPSPGKDSPMPVYAPNRADVVGWFKTMKRLKTYNVQVKGSDDWLKPVTGAVPVGTTKDGLMSWKPGSASYKQSACPQGWELSDREAALPYIAACAKALGAERDIMIRAIQHLSMTEAGGIIALPSGKWPKTPGYGVFSGFLPYVSAYDPDAPLSMKKSYGPLCCGPALNILEGVNIYLSLMRAVLKDHPEATDAQLVVGMRWWHHSENLFTRYVTADNLDDAWTEMSSDYSFYGIAGKKVAEAAGLDPDQPDPTKTHKATVAWKAKMVNGHTANLMKGKWFKPSMDTIL